MEATDRAVLDHAKRSHDRINSALDSLATYSSEDRVNKAMGAIDAALSAVRSLAPHAKVLQIPAIENAVIGFVFARDVNSVRMQRDALADIRAIIDGWDADLRLAMSS